MLMLFSTVRYIFVAILLLTILFLMPTYGILSVWYSTYLFSYSWSISAILLSGEVSTILLVFGFSACTVLVIYLFHRKVYLFSARKEKDDERRSSIQKRRSERKSTTTRKLNNAMDHSMRRSSSQSVHRSSSMT